MRIISFYTLLIVIFSNILLASVNDIEYSYVPKKVYKKQVFPISFLSTNNSNRSIIFNFDNQTPILKNAVIIKNGTKTFYTFYFKTDDTLFYIPKVTVTMGNEQKVLDKISIPIYDLPKKSDFCGVIASGLKIKSYQASIYDEKTNLIAISFEAHDANLEDIYIKDALKDGIENLKRTGSKIEGNYYIVLPANQKILKFSYFDTIKDKFIQKKLQISIDDGSVAAQTDLNPRDDSFEKLKKITLIVIVILFLTLFLWKRDSFYLILGVITSAILLSFYTPLSKICVKSGSALYIIPTTNSNISTYIDRQIITTELAKRGEYHKIEYKKGIIGWVKDEDICKN